MMTRIALLMALLVATAPVAAQTSDSSQVLAPASTQTNQEVDVTPAHTGWATLLGDTGRDFLAFPKRKSTWTLLAIGAAGALAARPGDGYVERHIVGNKTAHDVFMLGKWVGGTYFQVGSATALWAIGRYVVAPAAGEPKTNRYSHLGFDLIRAQVVSQALVHGMKYTVRRDRPTGECCAFPSGHAAAAFAAASVLERHLGYRGSWPALAGAAYVATSRLVDRRHFLSDVVFGAAVGEAVGWTVVGRHGREKYALQPVPVPGGVMLTLARVGD